MKRKIKVKVFRFDPTRDKKPRYETYEIPYVEKMRILDALDYIYDELTVPIAYRKSCQLRKCGTCSVLVNGEPALACWDPIPEAAEEVVIEPLPNFPIIKDLVVDRTGYDKRPIAAKLVPHRTEHPEKFPELIKWDENIDSRAKMQECIECLLCFNGCPVRDKMLEPSSFLQLCSLALDPRDELDRLTIPLSQGIYECMMCKRCEELCPISIEIPKSVMQTLRQLIVEKGLIRHPLIKKMLESTYKHGNPWGEDRSTRNKWAEDLKVRTFQKSKNFEILYFVGCTPSYNSRCQEVAKSLVAIFQKVGVNFGILGSEEKCCGDPALRMGEKGLFEMLKQENIRTFKRYQVHKIVTTSPHCYNTFVKDYRLDKDKIEVQHYTQFLWELIEQGKLKFSKEVNKVVTYHDPCFLGRYNSIYDIPRNILETIPGLSFVEMRRSKERSLCCGGGGGRIWIEDAPVEERLSVKRALEVANAKVDTLVTACPFCLINLDDAIKVIGKDEEIQVKDITELVREAM